MSEDEPETVSDEIRYAPRAVANDEWIADFLDRRPSGVLGLVEDGAPYLVTRLFVYDDEEHALFFHGATEGRTNRIVEGETEAAFTVSETGRLLPAEQPADFDVEYGSVVVFGTVALLEEADAKRRALTLFMEKFAPHLESGRDYEQMSADNVDRTAVYRLDVDRWSGKRNEAAADFPGAFAFDAVRED